jgi:hypothetical protein
MTNRWLEQLINPFRFKGRVDKIVFGLFIFINLVVGINAHLHNRHSLYDGHGHLAYVKALVQEGRLPTAEQTHMFYTAPFPYILPAAIQSLFSLKYKKLAKIGQYINCLLAFFAIYFFVKLLRKINPSNLFVCRAALFLLAITPVFYKTFAMGIRGEPYLLLCSILLAYGLANIASIDNRETWRYAVVGILLGVLLLSKQTGMVFGAPVLIFATFQLKQSKRPAVLLQKWIIALALMIVCCGWFYAIQHIRYDTFLPFNQKPAQTALNFEKYVTDHADLAKAFSAQNKEMEIAKWGEWHYEEYGRREDRDIERKSWITYHNAGFYLGTGNGKFFKSPVRDNFPSQFFPIFYSDYWGDYWGYFLWPHPFNYWKEDHLEAEEKSSYKRIATISYLGQVNIASIAPTMVIIFGLAFTFYCLFEKQRWQFGSLVQQMRLFMLVLIVLSVLSYMMFVIRYPGGHGSSIKASYLVHLTPFLSVLAAQSIGRVLMNRKKLLNSLVILLIVVGIHNGGVLITGISEKMISEREFISRLDIPHEYQ